MGPRAGLDIREERKICCPYGIRTPDRPARNLVTVLTELSRLVLSPVYVKYVVLYVNLKSYAPAPCSYTPNSQTLFRTQCTGTFTVSPRGSRLHTLCSGVSLVTAKQKKTEATENIRTVAMLLFCDYVTLFQDPKLNGAAVGPNSHVCASVTRLHCSQDI